MRKISVFNILFLLVCAALIVLVAFTAPREKNAEAMNQSGMTIQGE